jgi:YbbR domain-containing protein
MKKKITSNLVLKIISVIVAFLFWLVIINMTDPATTKTFADIPVKVLNENVITSANQVYEIEDGDTVAVTVKAKRSVIETLSASDFEATADMSDLSKVNAVSINVQMKNKQKSEENIQLDWGNAVMKVKLEKRVTQKFQVKVEHQGELSDNYVLGDIVAKPNIVEVSCGESKFKKIDHVGVLVTLNGESDNFEKEYSPVLYDEDGEIIDSSNVTFSNDTIVVSTEVLATKEVPVYVETKGKPAEGYRLAQTDFKPEQIRVSGSADALKKEVSIKIPINISGAKKDVEQEVQLADYIPSGLSIVGDTTTVSVRCEIEVNGSRSFIISASDIAVKNLPSNCTIEYEDETLKYSVSLTGKDSVLEGLTLNDLGAYIDLEDLSPGQHSLEVEFNLPSGVKLKKKIKVSLIIRGQGSDTTVATPTDAPASISTPAATDTPTPTDETSE